MTKKYQVAIHAIFRQETKWLREWLEYHLMIGVEHFYLFCDDDEANQPAVEEILEKYKGIVSCFYTNPALKPEKRRWPRDESFQLRPIRYILDNFSSEIEWLLVLDLDEFVFHAAKPEYPDLLGDVLNAYEKPEIDGLHIPVHTFGTSNLKISPRLQTESFVMCGKKDCFANRTAKNFYRVDKIKDLFSSEGKHSRQASMYGTDFKPSPGGKVVRPSDILRVNHYGTRSIEDWQAKLLRGNPFVKSQEDWDIKFKRYNQNDVLDDSMKIYVPELKKRMGI